MVHILVVDDDKTLTASICRFLQQNGYDAVGAMSADEAMIYLSGQPCDLIISDIMMPEMDGYELTELIRQYNKEIPILFVTARDDFPSKQRGFLAGIDDYMVKPIDLNELVLRVQALLRRAKIVSCKKVVVGSVELDAEEHTAYWNGEEVPLTVREFELLFKLLSYPKKTFTRTQLMDEFWDAETDSGTRTVDVYMTRIRNKFSGCTDFEIVTVHGLGYKAVIQ